ncbi:MAG: hypothetical protein AAGJ93_05830 [Bacteroidota bacterium]
MNTSSSSVNTSSQNSVNSRFNCPNCWGFQQWNDQYQATSITIPNTPKAASRRDSFVRKFMVKYLQKAR